MTTMRSIQTVRYVSHINRLPIILSTCVDAATQVIIIIDKQVTAMCMWLLLGRRMCW